MKNIAIIPARGGSKRIPNKNTRPFAGKPILAYSIEAAQASGLFDRIIVSTDSEAVARVARTWGAEVPFLRPAELADDFTPIVDVLLHAVKWVKENGGCDYVCCILATAPFLQADFLRQGLELAQASENQAAMSVCLFGYPIQRALKLNDDGELEMCWPEHRISRSQDLPQMYHDAAQFYWLQADNFLKQRVIFFGHPKPVVIPTKLTHDIDTEEDWEIAELKFRLLNDKHGITTSPLSDLPFNASRLVLGTAQLGFTYGITNRVGKPNAHDSNNMLCAAWAGGIHYFDTAQTYGDSEYVLGDFFAGSYGFSDARFITKLHPAVNVTDPSEIRRHIEESLRRLKSTHLWALLLHHEEHLDEWDKTLGNTLLKLQCEGLIEHLGISCYHPDYARRTLAHSDFVIVEVPVNIFDRRVFRTGLFEMARDAKKLVLIRSIFLQGLALLQPGQIPPSLSVVREGIATLNRFCLTHGLNPREFVYDYARAISRDTLVVVGAESAEQVSQNCLLPRRPLLDQKLVALWNEAWPDDLPEFYDPNQWQNAFAGPLSHLQSSDEPK